MSDFSADFKERATQQRQPTKLECGLLGALCATLVLGVLFWVAVQFSVLQLIVQIR
jgi:hypothetical protein